MNELAAQERAVVYAALALHHFVSVQNNRTTSIMAATAMLKQARDSKKTNLRN